MKRSGSYIILFFLLLNFLQAQQRKIDSLQTLLKKSKEDTSKVTLLLNLSKCKDLVDRKHYVNAALQLAEKLDFPIGKIHGLLVMGYYLEENSDFNSAISCYAEAENIAVKINNVHEILYIYTCYYNASLHIGNYPKALEIAFKGLKIGEQTKNKTLIGNYYNLIACVLLEQKNIPIAKEYFGKYLKSAEELQNKSMLANAYLNLVAISEAEKNSMQAIDYLHKALNTYKLMDEERTKNHILNNSIKERIAFTYNDISEYYKNQKEYKKALEYAQMCLQTCFFVMEGGYRKKNGFGINAYDLAVYYINLGEIYTQLHELENAEVALQQGLIIATDIPHQEDMKMAYHALSELYAQKSNFKMAFIYDKKYSEIKDSLLNEKTSRLMTEMNTKYQTEKKDKELIQKDTEIKNQQLESKQQSILRNALVIGFILVGLLALFIYRSYHLKQKANIAISLQKDIIELKKKEITDSIHYAKRIQKAIFASDTFLDKYLAAKGHDYFVLYKPKDIVSGDFYWAHQVEDQFLICTADCTGHGVPGAFMSLLSISFLNETTIEKKITRPDLILNTIRTAIINTLNTDSNEESKDGMDCVLCAFNFSSGTLTYAAANNTFYIVRNNELILSKADKMPVGKSPGDENLFTLQSFQLQKGDIIYTITDGYADQFGGVKGKKFKYKQLEEILLSHHQKSMMEQKRSLDQSIEVWRGNLEQVDDILIIGIKV